MKKLLIIIICLSTFLSSALSVSAEQGIIDEILNLQFEPEKIQYQLSDLPEKSFTNAGVQKKYDEMKYVNKILIDEFYKKYENGEIDYYTTNGIISQQKNFVYHTSKLFGYIDLKLRNPHFTDLDDNIVSSLSQTRISYNRIKFLYSRSKAENKREERKQYYRDYYGY